VDVTSIDAKIAADRGAMLIVKIRESLRISRYVELQKTKTAKTRVLDYCADEFMVKPIGIETIVYKMMMLLTTRYSKVDR
jgi:DNA-binding response OmpR family regulator